MKLQLSEYGNRVLEDMWLSKGCPKNIVIAAQNLDCTGSLRNDRFGLKSDRNYDGIHMNGKLGVQHYTEIIINILMFYLTCLM